MRTRRREHEREQEARREADRTERRETETAATVAEPPRTADDLLDVLADGDGLTYEEAALVGGIEEAAAGSDERDGSDHAAPAHGGW